MWEKRNKRHNKFPHTFIKQHIVIIAVLSGRPNARPVRLEMLFNVRNNYNGIVSPQPEKYMTGTKL